MLKKINILLAEPRGFCAGVQRAVDIVDKAINKYGGPVYVRHEIVHNKRVVKDLEKKGAIFVDELDQIPTFSKTIFSAHGVSKEVEDNAEKFKLSTIDATCPLVNKVHVEAKNYFDKGYNIILIGHSGHPEVEGINGRVPGGVSIVESEEDIEELNFSDNSKVAFVTQTTLSVDDTKQIISLLRKKYPKIIGQDLKDICYATQNRQTAVRILSKKVDLVIVIGGDNSSNTKRLVEIVKIEGVDVYRVSDAYDINKAWFKNVKNLGITAGASSPEILVVEVIEKIKTYFDDISVSTMDGEKENVTFKLPKSLL